MDNKESVTREFSDEQYKLDEEQENQEEVSMQTIERANEISQQYEEIKDRTLGDGMVAGRLEDIDTSPGNDNIVVQVDLPGESADKEFRFKKPKVWTKKYDFVRWIQHYGYDADSFPNMLKGECDVKVENHGNEDYKLFIPEYKNRRENVKKKFGGGNDKLQSVLEVYRDSGSDLYIAPVLLFLHIVHGLIWTTPILSYGVGIVSSFGLWMAITVFILGLWVTEDFVVKDRN